MDLELRGNKLTTDKNVYDLNPQIAQFLFISTTARHLLVDIVSWRDAGSQGTDCSKRNGSKVL